MQNELYISIDDLTYKKVDLFKDEPISVKQTSKDLGDITKVFIPYSLGFTIPASTKNIDLVQWFGDTKHIKNIAEFKFFCKIYNNKRLTFKGVLTLDNGLWKNGKAQHFSVKFETKSSNLKDKIKEDTLQDLGSLMVDLRPKRAETLLTGGDSAIVNGVTVSYSIPFVSNNRVWEYLNDLSGDQSDNIRYNASLPGTNIRLVKVNELRPQIDFKSIFNLIIKKYDLNINCPFFETNEYKGMTVWCNEEFKQANAVFQRLYLQNQFSNTFGSNTTVNISTGVFTSIYPGNGLGRLFFKITFNNLQIVDGMESELTVRLTKLNNGQTFFFKSVLSSGVNAIDFRIRQLADFRDYTIDFSWSKIVVYEFLNFKVSTTVSFLENGSSINNNNSQLMKSSYLDLFKILPPVKILDFIKSFTSTFNIQIINNNPNSNELFWLRKSDINTDGLRYSKNTIDYTKFTNVDSLVKSRPTQFNSFNFKHANSKYFSNVNFKIQFGKEYGQVVFPDTPVANPNQMKIETNFSIIPPVTVAGTTNLVTAYGFTNDTPERLATGELRYKPNFGELTIFHKLTAVISGFEIGIQSQDINGTLINKLILNVNRVAPFNNANNSLAFSNIIFNNLEFTASLFEMYYKKDVQRLLDPNVLLHNFKMKLPAGQISINEYTTAKATNFTPTGFRIQNDIIVGEVLFTIVDSKININNGDAEIQLLNY